METLEEKVESQKEIPVLFFDGLSMCHGILINEEEVRCSCCGDIFFVKDIIESAASVGKEGIIVLEHEKGND